MIEFRVTEEDEVSSTNDCIKALMAAGEAEGAVVIAQMQRGGYGRRGHAWESPRGGLYLSVLLRPEGHMCTQSIVRGQSDETALPFDGIRLEQKWGEKLPTLGLVVALAVRRAICRVVSGSAAEVVQVKWPNDVVVVREGRIAKLCGISLEGTPDGICLGIGVNVEPVAKVKMGAPVASVAALMDASEHVTPAELGEKVLDELGILYEEWLRHPFSRFLDEYRTHHVMNGKRVFVRAGNAQVQGKFAGVDECGRLLLNTANGDVVAMTSGEAHIESMSTNLSG